MIWRTIFGAKAQVVVGCLLLVVSLTQWGYAILHLDNQRLLVRLLIHASFEALAFAAYAIIATGLGYKATERVEQIVADDVDVERADSVYEQPKR